MTDRDADYVPALAYHGLTPLYDRVVAATTREREVKHALMVQAAIRPEHVVLDLASGTGTARLRRSAAIELATALPVLIVTTVLVATPMPAEMLHTT